MSGRGGKEKTSQSSTELERYGSDELLPQDRGGKIITFMHVGRGLMEPTHQSCIYTYVHGTWLESGLCYMKTGA